MRDVADIRAGHCGGAVATTVEHHPVRSLHENHMKHESTPVRVREALAKRADRLAPMLLAKRIAGGEAATISRTSVVDAALELGLDELERQMRVATRPHVVAEG